MALIDLPSLLFVVLSVCAAAVVGRRSSSPARAADSVVLQIGVTGTLIGLVQMLRNMDDPAHLGPALGLALLPAFYAALIKAGLDMVPREEEAEATPAGSLGGIALCVWLLVLVAAMLMDSGDLFAFMSVQALGAVVLSVIAIAAVSRAAGGPSLTAQLATHLPRAGLLIFFASAVLMLGDLHDPSAIGPAMALGLLGLLYTQVASIGIKLISPEACKGEVATTQWLGFSASLGGVLGLFGLVLIALQMAD